MGAERKIITEHVKPPIPTRKFDWCAHYDGDEENGICHGWGETKDKAIKSMRENCGELCSHCGKDNSQGQVIACGVGGCPLGGDA